MKKTLLRSLSLGLILSQLLNPTVFAYKTLTLVDPQDVSTAVAGVTVQVARSYTETDSDTDAAAAMESSPIVEKPILDLLRK